MTIHAQTTPMRTLLPAKPRTLYERYIDSLQTMRQNLANVQTSSIKADYAPLSISMWIILRNVESFLMQRRIQSH